ncbi:hypothetical protein P692DRAFT_201868845 [Suillus brevipes Sb2]|nr:hypothetical protein P692DRAFT_201868845 [Suillus brevipes Sb2]
MFSEEAVLTAAATIANEEHEAAMAAVTIANEEDVTVMSAITRADDGDEAAMAADGAEAAAAATMVDKNEDLATTAVAETRQWRK